MKSITICPFCRGEKQKSKLYPDPTTISTCMGWAPGYYDENGVWTRNENPNYTSREYRCSNGHRFSTVTCQGETWIGDMFTGEKERVYL